MIMAKYGYESDMFDPETVRREREKREKLANDCGPGGYNFRCSNCGTPLGASAMPGVVCYRCGCNTK
jgi:hypothetical protein